MSIGDPEWQQKRFKLLIRNEKCRGLVTNGDTSVILISIKKRLSRHLRKKWRLAGTRVTKGKESSKNFRKKRVNYPRSSAVKFPRSLGLSHPNRPVLVEVPVLLADPVCRVSEGNSILLVTTLFAVKERETESPL